MKNKIIFWLLWIFGLVFYIVGCFTRSEENITRALILFVASLIVQAIENLKE
jgi:hypothetical protein